MSPEKRQSGGNRALRIALRTVHILGFSVLFGGHWFNLPRETLTPWLYWTIFSGAGLMGLDLRAPHFETHTTKDGFQSAGRAGLNWFLQLGGSMVVAKLIVLSLIPLFWEQRLVLMALVLVLGSVGSHMPGSLRHFYLFPIRKRPI